MWLVLRPPENFSFSTLTTFCEYDLDTGWRRRVKELRESLNCLDKLRCLRLNTRYTITYTVLMSCVYILLHMYIEVCTVQRNGRGAGTGKLFFYFLQEGRTAECIENVCFIQPAQKQGRKVHFFLSRIYKKSYGKV